MHPALDKLCGPGKSLKPEAPDANELAGLLRTGTARLHDARNTTLALESRFDLAYNAAHALCFAAHELPRCPPLHRVSGLAAHAGLGPRGMASAGQMPQHTQSGRVRRPSGCR
jgi:hypothetical protein